MYMDTVVIAGLLIVGLTMAFFGAMAWMIKRDMKKHPEESTEK